MIELSEKSKHSDYFSDGICDRAVILGRYIIENKATVRSCAEHFSKELGISKSTVHKDISERLPKISPSLYPKVKEIIEENKRERHIRGGLATKHKYEELSKAKNQA